MAKDKNLEENDIFMQLSAQMLTGLTEDSLIIARVADIIQRSGDYTEALTIENTKLVENLEEAEQRVHELTIEKKEKRDHDTEIDNLEETNQNLEVQNELLSKQVIKLTTQMKRQTETITSLESEIESLSRIHKENHKDNIKPKKANIEVETENHHEIMQENALLKEEVKRLNKKLEYQEQDNISERESLELQREENTKLKSSLSEIHQEIVTLRQQNTEMQDRIDELPQIKQPIVSYDSGIAENLASEVKHQEELENLRNSLAQAQETRSSFCKASSFMDRFLEYLTGESYYVLKKDSENSVDFKLKEAEEGWEEVQIVDKARNEPHTSHVERYKKEQTLRGNDTSKF